MSKSKSSFRKIPLALLFAGMILLASYILKGTDYGQTVTYLLIAVWFSLTCIPSREHCLDKNSVGIKACDKTTI